MKRIAKYGLIALAAMLAVPAFAQKENPKSNNLDKKGSAQTDSDRQAQPAPSAIDSTYLIGASDELSINVWNQAQLTLSVPVRPDGMISMPLINDVQAAGLTPAQLRVALTEKLTKFVNDPHVTVIVTQMNSQKVYVLGQVAHAGAYPMLPGMTVLQAISSAGGLVLWAKETSIVVLRTENGKQIRLPFNYKDVVSGRNAEQNIVLKAGDTVVVP
jgi:polysaccharide biosynthesis/export protein